MGVQLLILSEGSSFGNDTTKSYAWIAKCFLGRASRPCGAFRYLAASVFNLRGSKQPDNRLVDRTVEPCELSVAWRFAIGSCWYLLGYVATQVIDKCFVPRHNHRSAGAALHHDPTQFEGITPRGIAAGRLCLS